MDFPKLFDADDIGKDKNDSASPKSEPLVYTTAPKHLLNILSNYDRIAFIIEQEWGTVKLKKFLDELLRDTRDHTRQGFPFDVASALIKLSLANMKYLESQGYNFMDPLKGTDYMGVDPKLGWKIPGKF